MKMKKLLSMGALALVIASSTSVASFAAVNKSTLTNDQAQVLTIMINALGDNKNANANNIVDTTKVKEYAQNHEGANKLADSLGLYGTGSEKVNDNAYETLNYIVDEYQTKDQFDQFKDQVNKVADNILAYDENTKEMDRVNQEEKVQSLLKDKDYTISFGKNSNGVTSISVEKSGNVVLQVSKDEVETLKDTCKSLSREDLMNFLDSQQ